jgi:hypothetical protein
MLRTLNFTAFLDLIIVAKPLHLPVDHRASGYPGYYRANTFIVQIFCLLKYVAQTWQSCPILRSVRSDLKWHVIKHLIITIIACHFGSFENN